MPCQIPLETPGHYILDVKPSTVFTETASGSKLDFIENSMSGLLHLFLEFSPLELLQYLSNVNAGYVSMFRPSGQQSSGVFF